MPGDFGNTGVAGGGSGTGTTTGVTSGAHPTQTCADAHVMATRVRPTVYVVVDGSGSMNDDFGGQSRWDSLRASLMDVPGGVIPELESVIDFGLVIYDGPATAIIGVFTGMPAADCAPITDVPPAPNNFLTINSMYWSAPPGGTTPTHTALQKVVDKMPDAATVQADPNLGSQYIILATDGAPNELCGGPPDAQAEVLRVTNEAAAKGIVVFVISLAGGDAQLQAHLEQVAMAGGSGYPPFTPMNRDQLTMTLTQILGVAISCDIVLNGMVTPGGECGGFVAVDGVDQPCNDDNGWVLKDPTTITLQGAACDEVKASPNVTIEAGFPCDVFTPD